MGDRERARRLAERSLSLGRELGSRETASVALPTMASIARADGDLERARRLLGEGLIFSAEIGDGTNVSYYLEGLAAISASEGDPERAAQLWGAAEAILEKIEVISYPHAADRSLNEEQLAAAREDLDRRSWEGAWAEGRAMTIEEAVAYALEDQNPESSRSSVDEARKAQGVPAPVAEEARARGEGDDTFSVRLRRLREAAGLTQEP
jgi:non-specific serine/threonine protein kinase